MSDYKTVKIKGSGGRITKDQEKKIRLTILEIVYHLEAVRKQDMIEALIKDKIIKTQRTGRKWIEKLKNEKQIVAKYLSKNGRKSYMVCLNADKGIKYLADNNRLEIIRRAKSMQHKGKELEQQARISRLVLQTGLEYKGRKDTKREYDISPNSLLKAQLTDSNGVSYLLYYMPNNLSDIAARKLSRELKENKRLDTINLVIYKSCEPTAETISLQKLLNSIDSNNYQPNSLCTLPDCYLGEDSQLVKILTHSNTENVNNYLDTKFKIVKSTTNRYNFGERAVVEDEEGQEWLVCDYLKRDQVALQLLSERLIKSEHNRNNFQAVVLTWEEYAVEVQQKLNDIQEGREAFIKIISLNSEDLSVVPK